MKNFLKLKTVILVTHQLHFLSRSSKILALDQGEGQIFDSLDAVTNSNTNMASLLRPSKPESFKAPKLRSEKMRKLSLGESLRRMSLLIQESSRKMSNFSIGRLSIVSRSSSILDLDFDDEPQKIEESQRSGSIDGKTYWTYFKAGSGVLFAFFVFLVNIASQILSSVSDMWLADWTNHLSPNERISEGSLMNIGKNDTFLESKSSVWHIVPENDIKANICIYFVLILTFFSITLLRGALFFQMTYRASVTLHDTIFRKILRSPMQMFEENPVGKIHALDFCSRF